MLGAIIGDIIGSPYEGFPIKTKEFPLFNEKSRFTDDTVLTIATADAIINHLDYASAYRKWARKWPGAGYGGSFYSWFLKENAPAYQSWGNGSAMRVSPVGFAFDTVEIVLHEAKESSSATHNHPEGIKGAQATALAIYLARTGDTKKNIRDKISKQFKYDLDRTINEIRPGYSFDISCQGTVPEAIIAFLDSHDYESAIRLAVSLGGDSDTLACITGGIAQAYYKEIHREIEQNARKRLPDDFLMIIDVFNELIRN